VWLSQSTRLDAIYSLGYLFVMGVPIAAVESAVFFPCLKYMGQVLPMVMPEEWTLTVSPHFEALMATIVTMLSIDFSSYWAHRAMHCVPFLWNVHSVHHSAQHLTPLTTYRQHPIEPLFLNACRGFAAAIGLAFFHAVFINATPVITVYGLGAGFFIYMFTTNLHHCTVPVRYPRWLRYGVVSPHIHQIHHSSDVSHHGRNFGVVFSIWDRIFGTYLDQKPGLGELSFGVDADNSGEPYGPRCVESHSLRASLLRPFTALEHSQRLITKNRRHPSSV
jgi:sterol desaturase/sphingolipid hydroxylase (fatty acid hydroxylase superfamily)